MCIMYTWILRLLSLLQQVFALTWKGVEAVSELLYGYGMEWDEAELLLSSDKEGPKGYPPVMFFSDAQGRTLGAEDTGPPGLLR